MILRTVILLMFLTAYSSNFGWAQSRSMNSVTLVDTIKVLEFTPGDSVWISPFEIFYYDNEKLVNGASKWLLTNFTIRYYLVPHLEEEKVAHSDDWFSQQRLAKYLSTLPQEDFDQFVKTYLFKESDFEELGEIDLN